MRYPSGMRPTRLLVWIGLLALVAAGVVAYGSLPAEIPRSIDAAGKARGLVPRSPLLWGFPLALAAGVIALADWISARLPRRPELFNFPGKAQLLALPSEYRQPAVRQMQVFMDVVNGQVLLTFAVVQWMLWRGAHGHTTQTATILLLVSSPIMLITLGLFVQRIQGAVDEAQRQYESRRNPLKA